MTTDNQPISAACVAALLSAMVPELARVELYPQWSDGTGVVVRRTRAVPYDAAGDIIELPFGQQRDVSGALRRLDAASVDLDRPQWLNVATGEVLPVLPPVRPLWLSLGLVAGRDDAAPSLGALLEQRHQLEDPAEPPLGGAQPDLARDYVASVAAGHVQPVVWEDAPVCEPVFTERTAEDVPVVGEAL